jgi:acyl-CoA thioesterase FadM
VSGDAAPAGRHLSLTVPYRIRFDESGPDGLARGSSLLGIVGDAAWMHSEVLGFTRAWYAERGLVWLVRSIEAHLLAAIPYGATVSVRTAVIGKRRVMARRESVVSAADGGHVADVWTDWVLTDARGAPTRIPNDFATWSPETQTAFEPLRVDRGEPPGSASELRMSVRGRDVDPMGHVNNSVYLDYLDEAVAAAGGGDTVAALPRRYALEYVGSAAAGDELRALAWPTPDGWTHRLERASDGAVLLRGTLGTIAPAG